MVSRIDIGPDGGPYVAINENNNDLELQDINGNVIAKWDETAGQWDLNNNSLTGINAIDASSVEANDLDIDSLTDGATKTLIDASDTDATNAYGGNARLQRTQGVSASAVKIFDLTTDAAGEIGAAISGGGLITVIGRDQDGSTSFLDLVATGRIIDPAVVQSITRSSPDGRTYTGASEDLNLAMDANTYDIIAIGQYAETEAQQQ